MMGAYTGGKVADQTIQDLIDSVKPSFESQIGQSLSQFKAISYKSQVVAGTNYKIKVQIADSEYVHAAIFKPLPYTGAPPQVKNVEVGKALDDQL